MRQIDATEREVLVPLLEAAEAAQDALQDARTAVDRVVRRLRRACEVPTDTTVDVATLQWCRVDHVVGGEPRFTPLEIE